MRQSTDIYTQVPDKTTRDALKRLSDLFDVGRADQHQAAAADKPRESDDDKLDEAR